jgi:hypothetical protein
MFCDRCGANLQPAQRFCIGCGKEIFAPIVSSRPAVNRVEQNIRVLAILWLVVAGIDALGGIFMWVVGSAIFASMAQMNAPPGMPIGFMQAVFGALGFLILIKAAVDFVVGWGLLKRKPWARLVTIILSFFTVLSFPLGTALGVYSLWVLLPAQSEREFSQLTAAPSTASQPGSIS